MFCQLNRARPAMGARQADFFGSFGADRLERSHVLQPFAGVSGGEKREISYKKVHLFIVVLILARKPRIGKLLKYCTAFGRDLQPKFFGAVKLGLM
jgi:hypothetical protein